MELGVRPAGTSVRNSMPVNLLKETYPVKTSAKRPSILEVPYPLATN